MLRYFRMKRDEIRLKAAAYRAGAWLLDNYGDVVRVAKGVYEAIKDVPDESLRQEFVKALAEEIGKDSGDGGSAAKGEA